MKLPRVVYALQHQKTGKIYVGSSAEVEKRIRNHILALRRNKHNNAAMQKDYNKHGGEYVWFILDEIASEEDQWKEYYWMEELHTDNPAVGYNGQDKYFRNKIKEVFAEFQEGIPTPNDFMLLEQEDA